MWTPFQVSFRLNENVNQWSFLKQVDKHMGAYPCDRGESGRLSTAGL